MQLLARSRSSYARSFSLGVWRNGSASDSRSEGWEFESLCAHFSTSPGRMWRLRKRATSLTILDILTQPAPRSSMPCFAHGLRARARFGKARQSAHPQKVAERREIRTPNLLQQCTLVGFEPTTSRRLLSGCSANCAIPPIPLFFQAVTYPDTYWPQPQQVCARKRAENAC